jgi:hypothetical protein
MGNRIIVVAVAVLLSVLAGCNRPSSGPTPTGAGPSWAKGTVDGVSCEVRGQGGESSSFVGEGYQEFTAGKNKLRVQGGRVTANGKEYGPVKSGDSVLLDADGTVTINGEKR